MNQPPPVSSPFDDLVGTELVEVSGSKVVARLPVTERLYQMVGLVHGGVYATVIESVASVGASAWLVESENAAGRPARIGEAYAVGISNHTDFIKATTDGTLTFTATPIQQGRLLQTWMIEVHNDAGTLVAHGNVKLANRPRK